MHIRYLDSQDFTLIAEEDDDDDGDGIRQRRADLVKQSTLLF